MTPLGMGESASAQHPPNENKVLVPVRITAQPTFELAQQGRGILRKVNLPNGPVAQLGARFHGMEEVEGSNPSRSTTKSLEMCYRDRLPAIPHVSL